MPFKLFLYALWCLAVVGLFLTTGIFSYSPFASAGRTGFGHGYYGPTHK